MSVLPQGTGIAATWNKKLIFQSGIMVSDESMAIQYNYKNRSTDYKTGASSVINIARDPRWGRVPETYGKSFISNICLLKFDVCFSDKVNVQY